MRTPAENAGMDVEALRSRPADVLVAVAITFLYGIERLATSLYAPGYDAQLALGTAVAAFVVTLLLWRGTLAGLTAAIVLYALSTLNLVLGAAVFGLTAVPLVVVTLGILAYLVVARDRVLAGPSAT